MAEAAHGDFAGLLGRGGPGHDPGNQVQTLADNTATGLLAAARRLDRGPVARRDLHGRVGREVVHAAQEPPG